MSTTLLVIGVIISVGGVLFFLFDKIRDRISMATKSEADYEFERFNRRAKRDHKSSLNKQIIGGIIAIIGILVMAYASYCSMNP